MPKHDVHYDLGRIRRLAVEAIAAMSDEDLAERVGAPVELVPALRGARDLIEAASSRGSSSSPSPSRWRRTRGRRSSASRSYAANGAEPKEIVRELKAVGGDLRGAAAGADRPDRGPSSGP